MIYAAPYTIKLWYPCNVAYVAATYSIEVKSYEIGNKEELARNQTFTRTRGGTTKVYDRGNNFDTKRSLQFRNITDTDRAKWLIFLAAVQWGSSKLAFQDYNGTQYVIRIENPKVAFTDGGYICRETSSGKIISWDFDLDFLDLTNSSDLSVDEVPPLSALGIHLTDYNDPHNPKTTVTVNIADGAKVIESFSTELWKSVDWYVEVEAADHKNKGRAIVSGVHNGTPSIDATTVNDSQTTIIDPSGILAGVTFTVVISGAGASQIMTLKCAATVDGTIVNVRRMKF